MKQRLNRALFLGLFEFEGHFALYPEGAFYRTHYDSFRGAANTQMSPEQLAWIEHRINTTPRRSLNWDTANDVYHRLSAPTT